MTDIKKASDVILEIDSKIDNLLNFFKNHDNNQKLIISRLDKIYKKLEEMPEDRNFSSIAQDLEQSIQKNSANEFEFVDVPSVSDVSSAKKVLVHQTIKYPKVNNKQLPVILAKVNIYKEPGLKSNPQMKPLESCVTNANGIWEAELSPGTYYVHIVKPNTNTKPLVDVYNEIIVSSDSKVQEIQKIDL